MYNFTNCKRSDWTVEHPGGNGQGEREVTGVMTIGLFCLIFLIFTFFSFYYYSYAYETLRRSYVLRSRYSFSALEYFLLFQYRISLFTRWFDYLSASCVC